MAIAILFLAVLLASGVALGCLLNVWDLEKRNERLRDQYEALDAAYDDECARGRRLGSRNITLTHELELAREAFDAYADAQDDKANLADRRIKFLTQAAYAADVAPGEADTVQRFRVYELMQELADVVIEGFEYDAYASPEAQDRDYPECVAMFDGKVAKFIERGEQELASCQEFQREREAADAEAFKAEESVSCPCGDPACGAEYYPPYDLKDVDAVFIVLDEDELSYEERNGV